eukprot:363901-Chlamydomonas_euryale.AAC.38
MEVQERQEEWRSGGRAALGWRVKAMGGHTACIPRTSVGNASGVLGWYRTMQWHAQRVLRWSGLQERQSILDCSVPHAAQKATNEAQLCVSVHMHTQSSVV